MNTRDILNAKFELEKIAGRPLLRQTQYQLGYGARSEPVRMPSISEVGSKVMKKGKRLVGKIMDMAKKVKK